MTDWRKQLLDNVEQRKQKNIKDTLKAKRTYREELSKNTPEYKATKAKETEAKRIKAETNLKKAKKEAKPETGDQAITRLTKEYKALIQNLYNAKGEPLFRPEQMRPGKKRLRELEKKLSLAEKASASQSSFEETVDKDKAGEFARFYTNLPSKEGKIDPRKALYMSRLSMDHYLKNK
tara:strand:+ start:720 stop:1253 length:534 start_codon:yes stop_codon:yes gene_type:complete